MKKAMLVLALTASVFGYVAAEEATEGTATAEGTTSLVVPSAEETNATQE